MPRAQHIDENFGEMGEWKNMRNPSLLGWNDGKIYKISSESLQKIFSNIWRLATAAPKSPYILLHYIRPITLKNFRARLWRAHYVHH